MRLRPIHLVAVVALGVAPAQSAQTDLEKHTLTLIDTVPTKDQILNFTSDPVPHLSGIALDNSSDFGVRLRAIRALPVFCSASSPTCKEDSDGQMHPIRATVRDVIASVSPTDRDGRAVLRLRAGIESLGVIRSGEQSDVDLLVPFLDHPARDIRFATARALRELCMPSAESFLRNRYDAESVAQVRLAISAALGDLAQCSQ